MNKYQVTDPQGRSLEIEGDHEPTAAELSNIFSQAFPDPGQEAAYTTGWGYSGMKPSDVPKGGLPAAMEPGPLAKQIAHASIQGTLLGQASNLIPALTGATEKIEGLTAATMTPGGAVLGATGLAVPPLAAGLGAAMSLPMISGGYQETKQGIQERNLKKILGGVTEGAMGVAGLAGAGYGAGREFLASDTAAAHLVGRPDLVNADYAAQVLSLPPSSRSLFYPSGWQRELFGKPGRTTSAEPRTSELTPEQQREARAELDEAVGNPPAEIPPEQIDELFGLKKLDEQEQPPPIPPPPPGTQGMFDRRGEAQGTAGPSRPTWQQMRDFRAREDWWRAMATEVRLLKEADPELSHAEAWKQVMGASRAGYISAPTMSGRFSGIGGRWAAIMSFVRPESRPAQRFGAAGERRLASAAAEPPPLPAIEQQIPEPPPPEEPPPAPPGPEGYFPPPPTTREMTPRPELERGAPTVEDVRAQRQRDMRDSLEWKAIRKELEKSYPGLSEPGRLSPDRLDAWADWQYQIQQQGPQLVQDLNRLLGLDIKPDASQAEIIRAMRGTPEWARTREEFPALKEPQIDYIFYRRLQGTDPRRLSTTQPGEPYARSQRELTPVKGVGNVEPSEKTGISSGDRGRRGNDLYINETARKISSSLREGNAIDLQHVLTSSAMDSDSLGRLYSQLSTQEQAALQAIRDASLRGRSISEAAQEAIAVFNREAGTGKGVDPVSVNEASREGRQEIGSPKESAGKTSSPSEQTQISQQERIIEHASRVETPTTLYGSLRAFTGEGVRGLPVKESGSRVQSQAEGGLPAKAPEAKPDVRVGPTGNEPAQLTTERATQAESPPGAEAGPTMTSAGSAAEVPPVITEATTPETPPQVGKTPDTGPGLADMGAALRVQVPGGPSRFAHWWDANFGESFRKIAPTLMSIGSKWPIWQNMARFSDIVDTRSRIFARQTTHEIERPLERLASRPTVFSRIAKALGSPYLPFKRRTFRRSGTMKKSLELYQDALTAVRESGENATELQRMRNVNLGAVHSDATMRYWQQREADAIDFALYNLDELAPISRQYRDYMDTQVGLENVNGIPTQRRLNYVPHRQEIEEMTLLTNGGKGEATFFEKNRTYPTYADSIAAGVRPRTLSATQLMENRLTLGSRLIGNRRWLSNLRTWTDPTTGKPIAVNMIKQQPSGQWVPPSGYSREQIGSQSIAIHNGYEGIFRALTNPSFFHESAAGRAFLTFNATGKSINLAVDTFHLGRIAFWDSMIKMAGISTFKLPVPTYRKGVTLLDYSESMIRDMAARGEIPQRWLNELTENKRRTDLMINTGYNIGRITDGLYNNIIHDIPLVGSFNRWIFDQFQRGAMHNAWLLEFQRYRKGLPHLSEIEVAKRVTQDLNRRFGNLGRQGWFKSRTAQDIARILFLAPQWNEGLIMSEFGALRDIPRMAMDAAKSKRLFAGVLLRSSGGMATMFFIANQIINQATRGKFTWENPEEGFGAKLSAWIPDLLEGGPGFFLHPLGLAAETTHLLTNMYSRAGGDLTKVGLDYVRSRSSSFLRPFWTWVTRSDVLGRYKGGNSLLKEIGKSFIPTPIAFSAGWALGKQLVTGQPSQVYEGQYQKQAMASMGVRTERAPSEEQRMLNLARNWRQEHGVPKKVIVEGEGEYRDLTSALRVGNRAEAQRLIDGLRKTKTDQQILQHFQRWEKAAFTGSAAREREFQDSLSAEQQIAYLKARDARERVTAEVSLLLQ